MSRFLVKKVQRVALTEIKRQKIGNVTDALTRIGHIVSTASIHDSKDVVEVIRNLRGRFPSLKKIDTEDT